MRKYYKIIATTTVAIILGAVGSGVWEYILEPLVATSTKAMLNVATLGVESFKNDVYITIAKGFHEKASYTLLAKVDVLVVLGLLIYTVNLVRKVKTIKEDRANLLKKIHQIESGEKPEEKSLIDIKNELESDKIHYLLKTLYALVSFMALLFSAQFVASKTDIYINQAITHYQQAKSIIAPYISSKDLLLFDSRFSQIKTPNDYYEIMNQLESVAKKEKVDLPYFDAW